MCNISYKKFTYRSPNAKRDQFQVLTRRTFLKADNLLYMQRDFKKKMSCNCYAKTPRNATLHK